MGILVDNEWRSGTPCIKKMRGGRVMKLLALDTATPLSGVAVGDPENGNLTVRRARVTTHSETLLSLIAECLKEQGWVPRDIEGVACGAGPGSFTGLRIGAATAKGMCYALGAPLVMISSLLTLAARAARHSTTPSLILSCIDAGRGQVYARVVASNQATEGLLDDERIGLIPASLQEEAQWEPSHLGEQLASLTRGPLPLLLVGDGAFKYAPIRVPGSTLLDDDLAPHPADLLRLGAARLLGPDRADLASASPNYICPSAAERHAVERGQPGPR